jgi:capsular polysaccharide biosynthesis protein
MNVSQTVAAKNIQRRMRRSTLTFFTLFIAVIAFVLPNALFNIISGLIVRLLGGVLHPAPQCAVLP